MARKYTMDNCLCSGLTPQSQSEIAVNEFQKRLVNDKEYRKMVQFQIAKSLSAMDSRITSCFTDIYIDETTDYLIGLLMNNSVLPTVYHIVPKITLEDEEEYEGDAVIWLTTPEDRELNFVNSKSEEYESGYYVLSGTYILHVSLPGFLDAQITFEASGDSENVEVPVLLQREIESI